VKYNEVESVVKHAGCADVFILGFCGDRASSNKALLREIWRHLCRPEMPRVVLPFAEMCLAHGVALVIVAASSALASNMRQWRFGDAFRSSLLGIVKERLRMKREPRPAGVKKRAFDIVEQLYGNCESAWLHKSTKSGDRVRSDFYNDLLALAELVDVGRRGTMGSLVLG